MGIESSKNCILNTFGRGQVSEGGLYVRNTCILCKLWELMYHYILNVQGDLQSQAMVRAVARQVCEQLIQCEYKKCCTIIVLMICRF